MKKYCYLKFSRLLRQFNWNLKNKFDPNYNSEHFSPVRNGSKSVFSKEAFVEFSIIQKLKAIYVNLPLTQMTSNSFSPLFFINIFYHFFSNHVYIYITNKI